LVERERMHSLIEAATASANWEQVYEDDKAVIFRLRGGL
jgi:hypothetical protein